MARTDRRAAALLALALLLSGCSGRQAAGGPAPDLTERKRWLPACSSRELASMRSWAPLG